MKKLLLIGLIVALNACNNDDDQSTNPIDQLPPATQTGERTAGALINGKPLLPRGGGVSTGPNLSCFYQLIDNEYFFALGIDNYNGNEVGGLIISVNRLKLKVDEVIILNKSFINDGDFNGGSGYYIYTHDFFDTSNGGGEYSTTSEITGELIITYLDETNQIISGIFWFDAINSDGEIVKIREGRFDMPYSK